MALLGFAEELPEAAMELEALESIYEPDASGLLSGVSIGKPDYDRFAASWRLPISVRPSIEGFVALAVDIASAVAVNSFERAAASPDGRDERTNLVLRRNESAQGEDNGDGHSAPRLRVLLVKHLAPLSVVLHLPSSYPNDAPPTAAVTAPWLSASAAAGMASMLRQLWEEAGHGQVLYSFCEWLRLEAVPWTLAGGSDAAAAAQWALPLSSLSSASAYVVQSPGSSSQYRHEYAAAVAQLLERLERANGSAKSAKSTSSASAAAAVGTAASSSVILSDKALRIGGAFWLPSEGMPAAAAGAAGVAACAVVATGGAGSGASPSPSLSPALAMSEPLDLLGLVSVLERLLEHDEGACMDEWAASDVECPLCLAGMKGARCIRMSACGHAFCVPCLQRHVATGLRFDASAATAAAASSSPVASGGAGAPASAGAVHAERLRAAEACPDPSCSGKLSLPEMRAACVHGTSAAAAAAAGASSVPPSHQLLAALEQCAAAADEHAAQLALAGVGEGDAVVPCPRHKCGRPAILQETKEPFLLRLESDWAPALVVNPSRRPPALVASQFGEEVPDRRTALRQLFASKPSADEVAASAAASAAIGRAEPPPAGVDEPAAGDHASAAASAAASASGSGSGLLNPRASAWSSVMEAAFKALPPPPPLAVEAAGAASPGGKRKSTPVVRRGPPTREDLTRLFATGSPPPLSLGTCAACGHAFCGECLHSWHGGAPCTMRLRTPADAVVQAARIQAATGIPSEHALVALSRPPPPPVVVAGGDDDGGGVSATRRAGLRPGVALGAPTNAARFLAQKQLFGAKEGAEAATGALWRGMGTVRDIDFDPWAAGSMWKAAARASKRAGAKSSGMDETAVLREALLIATTTRACPRCKALVARISGCRHMVCVCGLPFCFDCGLSRSTGPCACERGVDSMARVGVSEKVVTDILKRM